MKSIIAAATLAIAALGGAAPGHASVQFLTPAAPFPGFAGDGLIGTLWLDVPFDMPLADRTLAYAQSYIGTHQPSARFFASSIDYPRNGSTVNDTTATVADFLGPDAATLSQNVGSRALAHSTSGGAVGFILQFSGYVNSLGCELAGFPGLDFRYCSIYTQSDDGSMVTIGQGAEAAWVSMNDGIHAFSDAPSVHTSEFFNDGLYAINVLYFDGEPVEAGLTLCVGTPGMPCNVVPTSQLYTRAVDEPATLAMFAAALVAAGWRRRRPARA